MESNPSVWLAAVPYGPNPGCISPEAEPRCGSRHKACKTEARPGRDGGSTGFGARSLPGACVLLVPYFPWRFDLPGPGTIAIIAAVLLFCAWRACRRS
ncbi:MAG: hypothetical protein KatS3mg004_0327 [Bryobacteraceae bacterium]|nr:MAG: hypothetical protein KatS3mg004_0327 [Bryobacteraceae bacterium]